MIVVTGGAGYIGRHLVRLLLAGEDCVRAVDLPGADFSDFATEIANGKLEIATADIRNRVSVRAALSGCGCVYHLAANPNLWTRHRDDFDAVNHRGAVHVMEEALAAGAHRVLHVSTESILTARHDRAEPIETANLDEKLLFGPYTMSKLRAERAALTLAAANKPVLVANPTLPVGPGDRGLSPPSRMTRLFCQGKMPFYLECRFNMIDVRDLALGLFRVMAMGSPGRRYILGAHNVRLSEWLGLVGAQCGRSAPKWRIPYWMALGYAHGSELMADWVTGSMPNATVTGVRLTRHNMQFDSQATLKELGIVPRPLSESAAAAAQEHRKLNG